MFLDFAEILTDCCIAELKIAAICVYSKCSFLKSICILICSQNMGSISAGQASKVFFKYDFFSE